MEARLITADCLEWMRNQPDNCVDLVFTSPPYEDARTYRELNYRFKGQEWVDWCLPRFEECLRLSQGLVAWVVQGKQIRSYEYSGVPQRLFVALQDKGYCPRSPLVFHSNGIPGSGGKDWLRKDHHDIICFTFQRGRLPWSDNTAMGGSPKYPKGGELSHRKQNGDRVRSSESKVSKRPFKIQGQLKGAQGDMPHATHGGRSGTINPDGTITRKDGSIYEAPKKTNPGSVIRHPGGHLGSELAHENEAPFPEYLAEFFIRSFCPPNGTVLDPFSGSGTTVAAGIKSGRNGTGIDCRESQTELAIERLQSELGDHPCSLLVENSTGNVLYQWENPRFTSTTFMV